MQPVDPQRLHALDAVRGFALLLGVAFHAALSFMPGWPPGLWAMADSSPSALLGDAAFVSHVFRMTLFFFIAGFFARLLQHRLGNAAFCRNRLLRIAVPLVAGWVLLYPLVSMVWIAGITKAFGGNLPPMPEAPKVFGAFPLMHLWFLYQLLQFYAIALLLGAVAARVDPQGRLRGAMDRLLSAALRVPVVVLLLLAVPVASVLMALPTWYYWSGIPTPDQSLVPQLAPLLAYGVAFAFGWLVQRSHTALVSLARHWLPNLLVGAIAATWMLLSLRVSPMAPPGPANPLDLVDGTTLTKSGFALMHGLAAWGLTLGIAGAALRFLAGHSPLRRYIADASYWVYLAHLPLVAALQVWVGQWPLHWSFKYPFVLLLSLALLFASYHWLVRPTLIGQLLNGRRIGRTDPTPTPPSSPSPAPPPGTGRGGSEPVAALRGITKTFGGITALDNVYLEVGSGELLALLGPNGAGKSTAIALWLGLVEADGGEVALLGGVPQEAVRRQGLGAMMQDVELPKELTPRELVGLASSYYVDPLPLDETLRRAGIATFADRHYGKLSGGQKRLTQFAVAICGQPRVLFLDEPSVGLDVQAREALWSSIRHLLEAGSSIVLTTHYLEEAEALADRVAVIAKGHLVASGSVDDMRALVARRRISCESRLGVAEVGAWPGVQDARRERDRLHLTASDAESVVRRLLAEDPSLSRLEVREAGLNEAFNALTREAA
ncbi:acyltransferase family protein [Luteimonas viscosa]|uniref:Acyltransferase family protein n=1 Tax=Luteimonas viscosa TaxID=1132694 RepID=A0A5D4XGE9_9GAMM|nr:acyltransferase family protein [Luteimonas viscosa]TYT23688.1 acyltransferase family protein [Luteimonas viscosa]